jgi:hypothetical protein
MFALIYILCWADSWMCTPVSEIQVHGWMYRVVSEIQVHVWMYTKGWRRYVALPVWVHAWKIDYWCYVHSENLQEKRKQLYHVFVDLEKAFDKVPKSAIRWYIRRQNIPVRLLLINHDLAVRAGPSPRCTRLPSLGCTTGPTPPYIMIASQCLMLCALPHDVFYCLAVSVAWRTDVHYVLVQSPLMRKKSWMMPAVKPS